MTSFYIATSLSRARDHNHVRDALITNGHRITYDWTMHGSVKTSTVERLSEVAHSETDGVLSAEIVVILLPGGYGTHAELGMALALKKKIILHSVDTEVFTACEKTCAFYHHRDVLKLVCPLAETNAFLKAMQNLAPQSNCHTGAILAISRALR
ncbi:MAG TPA: nucleoside 2-deoxyribosyltransferase [Myxococcota bacterium]|nr:nucleoside 2-deoxyribosyltransferase [Myxococcota bacterium]